MARRLGWRFLDTGVMYRAATWAAIQGRTDLEDGEALTRLVAELDMRLVQGESGARLIVNGRDITDHLRDSEVEDGVSPVATVSGVRSALVKQQRAIAREGPIVMVGRDIGEVVLPDAAVKVFLRASAEVRARRRCAEMQTKGSACQYERVVGDLVRRDKIDSERVDSPLRPARGAVLIGTDDLTVDEVAEKILSLVRDN